MLRRISTLEHAQPTHQRLYSLMGESLLFETNEPALLQAADEAFGRFPRGSNGVQPPLVLRLFVADAPRRPEEGRPRPVHHTQGHLMTISVGAENMAVADLMLGYAFGFVTPDVASDRAFVRYTFVEDLSLSMLEVARHFVPLHAACVVKEGVSVLLFGRAGTGKSTLAFACARRGYQVLAEDVVEVKVRSDEAHRSDVAQLWGVPWKIHPLPDARRCFPELADEQLCLQMNGEWKLEIDLETLFPGSTTTNAAPGLVVFLERATQPACTLIEPLPLAEALDKFEVLWPWSVGWTDEMEQGAARLLEQGTYRMWMNGSPDEAVDALDALLEFNSDLTPSPFPRREGETYSPLLVGEG